jgi:NTE family protein
MNKRLLSTGCCMRAAMRVSGFVAALVMSGCSTTHYPINPALERVDAAAGYRAERAFATQRDDRVFMHVSISGGGARAAALGLGVLQALGEVQISKDSARTTLLDEMDLLMGVSGGSILAAYYALHGAQGLQDFERRFFSTPWQSSLLWRALSPRGWWRLQSPRFGRGDLLAELLDEHLFKGATFADLSRRPRKPFVVIYASDMSTGARFEFVQDQFDFLCSRLDAVPLARAVAASSAVPLLLAPITFWNHAPGPGEAGCGEPPLNRLLQGPTAAAAAYRLNELNRLRATDGTMLLRPFVHLLDGGLSDNVGARGPMDYVAQFGSVIEGTRQAGYRGVREAVFIVVNAETSARSPEDRSANVPGPLRSALALADIPINRNSATAMAEKRRLLQRWEAEVRAAHARGEYEVFAKDARFHLIEVSLAEEADEALRERLLAIPTTLELPAADVAALASYAREALQRSPDFQRLRRALDSAAAPLP